MLKRLALTAIRRSLPLRDRLVQENTIAFLEKDPKWVLYPLDDPNPKHLQKNRQFFEQQMDRFKRQEARLRYIQNPEYR